MMKAGLYWNRTAKTISFEGADGKKGTAALCEEVAPRTMIDFYKSLKPR